MIWEEFFPISKGCPFASSIVDRLDFFFSSKPPKALCLITLWHFPHSLGMVAGLRFKKPSYAFQILPAICTIHGLLLGTESCITLKSSLLSSTLTLEDKIWSRWDLIFNFKLRSWSQSIQNAINQSLISLCSHFALFTLRNLHWLQWKVLLLLFLGD